MGGVNFSHAGDGAGGWGVGGWGVVRISISGGSGSLPGLLWATTRSHSRGDY